MARPKGAKNKIPNTRKCSFEELARTHTDVALNTLVKIMKDDGAPQSARVSASTALLDRGYGKPRQALEVTGEDGGPVKTEMVISVKFVSPK